MKAKLSLRKIAGHYNVAASTVQAWQARGCPLDSFEAIDAWKTNRNQTHATGSSAPVDLNAARLNKINIDAERSKIKLELERGNVVTNQSVEEKAAEAFAILCAELDAAESDLAGQIAGETEIVCRQRLRSRFSLLKVNLKTRLSGVGATKRKKK